MRRRAAAARPAARAAGADRGRRVCRALSPAGSIRLRLWARAPAPRGHRCAGLFRARANDATPLPGVLPNVVWWAGLDLNPLRVCAPDDMAWLETLVWPEQQEPPVRLRAAIQVARRDPPRVVQGNLLHDLRQLAAAAPSGRVARDLSHRGAGLHRGSQSHRDAFADLVRDIDAVWTSNEMPGTFPRIAAKARRHRPRGQIPAGGEWTAGRLDRVARRIHREVR